MKRLTMIAAGIVLAAAAHAATIDWGMANNAVTWLNTLNTTPAGTQYYLVLDSYRGSIIDAINGVGGATFSTSTAGVLELGLSTNAKGYIAGHAVGAGAGSELLDLGGTKYSFSILVFDTKDGVDYYRFSSAQESTAYDQKDPVYYEAMGVTFGASHFASGNWTAVVPEPASMALLVLGAAAVGLRRRFRR